MQTENHLFVIWPKASGFRERILADLTGRFEMLRVVECHWERRRFLANLMRFYDQPRPILMYKKFHCGTGPFLVCVVRDRTPEFASRETTSGIKTVNTNVFDAKETYRRWMGGGHRVHATNTRKEFNKDFTLLFGVSTSSLDDAKPWDGVIEEFRRDTAGLHGWKDLRELFSILNDTVAYVVLRNFDSLLAEPGPPGGDIDVLSDNLGRLRRLANARPGRLPGRPAHHRIRVGGTDLAFDFRIVGDGYYDEAWEKRILETRRCANEGFCVPDPVEHFYSLLYHAAVHKRVFPARYAPRLAALAQEADVPGVTSEVLSDPTGIKRLLDAFMQERRYRYTDPRDLSVHYNPAFVPRPSRRILRRIFVPMFRWITGRRKLS